MTNCTINTVRDEAYKISDRAKADSLGVYIPFDTTVYPKHQWLNARNEALRVAKKLNETFKATTFGKVATINSSYSNGVGINISIPKRLEKAYEVIDEKITQQQYLAEVKDETIDFTEESEITEEDYEDQINYNELTSLIAENLMDEQLSNSALEFQNSRESLFSIMKSPNNNINDKSTFPGWKEHKLKMIDDLNKMRTKYAKGKKTTPIKKKISKISKLINEIQDELLEYDDTDPEVVHASIVQEINNLRTLLKLEVTDPSETASLLETNKIEDRIKALDEQIRQVNVDAVLLDFNGGLDETKLKVLRDDITGLKELYRENLEKFVMSVILSNDIVQKAEERLSPQELETFRDRIEMLLENVDKADGDVIGSYFLTESSYDNIFVEIIGLIKTINETKEHGRTNSLKQKLKEGYNKIKNIKVDEERLTDLLFITDDFGTKTNRLISPFSEKYFNKIKDIKRGMSSFYTAMYSTSPDIGNKYRVMMNTLKDNVSYIEPYKLLSIKKSHGTNPEFEEYFKYSEQEMAQYEAEMRSKMGDIAFEAALKKSTAELELFIEDETFGERQRYQINPMTFINHFYSENYNKEDQVKFEFIQPRFTSFIPTVDNEKYNEYYNDDFKEIESEQYPGFSDFYSSATELLEYVKEANPYVKVNDVMSMRDELGRAAMKDLSVFKKVGKYLYQALKSLGDNFYKGSFENREGVIDYDTTTERKLTDHYSNYGAKEIKQMKEALDKRPFSELIDIAKQEGLTLSESLKESKYVKQTLAESIARNRINKSSSLDIFQRINTAVQISESSSSRKATLTSVEMIEQFLSEKKAGASEAMAYIKTWKDQNLLQTGYTYGTKWSKAERQKLMRLGTKGTSKFNTKSYTSAEKELKKILQEERTNLNGEYNFKVGENQYTTGKTIKDVDGVETDERGKFFKVSQEGTRTEISIEEIEEKYVEHIDQRIEKLGLNMILGSVIAGTRSNMYSAYLALSAPTGIKNRLAGYNQNNQAAASGLHGFDRSNLIRARQFLQGRNINRYIPGVNIMSAKKAEQQKIFMNLLHNYNLIDKVYEDITGETSVISEKMNAVQDFMGDFSMNNPEFHNQGELLVAMMQNTMIEVINSDGSIGERPLFDPETNTFPFNSQMELLPQYQTESNIENWKKGEGDTMLSFLQSYRNIKNKLHGDYSGTKIKAETSAGGRAGVAMLKWFFENFTNQWGTKKVNLSTGEVEVKGRKIIMAEHMPVLATHFALQNVVTGGLALSIGSPVLIAMAGVAGGISLVYLLKQMKTKNKMNVDYSKGDAMMALGYALEASAKTLRTVINTSTFSQVDVKSLSGENFRKNESFNRGISEKDRMIMSESAQEVADKLNMSFQFLVAGFALKALYYLLNVDDDDDEETVVKKMKEMDDNMNYVINLKNSMTSDIEQWTNPVAFTDVVSSGIYYNFIKRGVGDMATAYSKYDDNRLTSDEAMFKFYDGASGLFLGTPRQANKMVRSLYSDQVDYLSNDRIYDNNQLNRFDKWLLSSHLKGEAYYKDKIRIERGKARDEIERTFRGSIRREWEKEGRTDFYNLDEEVSKKTTKFLRSNDAYKGNGTDEELYNTIDWEKLIEKAQNE